MPNILTEAQIDALREVSNIGSGHAAIALSQMIGKKIMIAVTRSEIIPSQQFLKNFSAEHSMVVAVYLEVLGDLRGAVIYMFEKDSALKLTDMLLTRKSGETKFIDEKAQSGLKETCNILLGSFCSILADMLELRMVYRNPYFAFDKADLIMYGVCEQIFGSHEERLCLTTQFIESSSQISGSFVFIPGQESMDLILKKLKVA